MKNRFFITGTVVLTATVLFLSHCQSFTQTPNRQTLEEIVYKLTDPGFKGRRAGSPHDSTIAVYIAHEMAQHGFTPYFDDGPLHRFSYRNVTSWNVVMVYKGKATNGSVLIGAHYDHLGLGGPGSGSLRPDTVAMHPGADDNASGVAAAMETARLLKEAGKHSGLQKDIIFAAFGAEEQGTVGSAFLADTLEKDGVLPSLMINLDMVGRLKDSTLQVSGTGTFTGADSLLQARLDSTMPLLLRTSASGYGPSDHSTFYRAEVPVLFFTTGPHTDYHTPFDTPDKIDFDGLAHIVRYATSIATAVAVEGFEPVYQETYDEQPMPDKVTFKASLGVIPDFIYEGEGFCAGTVIKGRPGHKAGMEDGDVVVQINDRLIATIEEYMEVLGELTAGEIIWVTVRRKDRLLELEVQL
ncbi:MAG: M20/M25/M40 family metallo-hydrolase [Bacteroidales bacterium]|nr:M20/M25/M40 family metallo-hydrolase [Bacteroidales bacterium]